MNPFQRSVAPREKLMRRGVESMTDAELLAAIISTGTSKLSYMEVAREVVKKFSSTQPGRISMEEICSVAGMGSAKSAKVLAAIELGRRFAGDRGRTSAHKIYSSSDVLSYCSDIRDRKREYVKAIFANGRLEVLGSEIIAIGSFNRAIVHPRDILVPALEHNAAYLVIVHNHPSGMTSPSKQDLIFTKRLLSSCELVGIKLLDHLIISGSGWESIRLDGS